jgi:hypothetical protein
LALQPSPPNVEVFHLDEQWGSLNFLVSDIKCAKKSQKAVKRQSKLPKKSLVAIKRINFPVF